MKYFLLFFVVGLVGCGMKTVRDVDAETEAGIVDYSNKRMRHGSIFMPPSKTRSTRRDESQISKGQGIYQRHCLGCHGSSGKGDGPNARTLNPKPANLKKIAGRMPDIHFFIQIDAGPGEMPAWRDMLSPEDMQALTQYLQSL